MYDRPRGILTKADREFLASDKSGYSRQQQYNARKRIRERVVNAFLDLAVLEEHLSAEERDRVFDSFDAKEVGSDDVETYSDHADHVKCLTDALAFIYRETSESESRHPPFEMILEHALYQGQAEPGADVFGRYNVSIEVEEIVPEEVDVASIVERVNRGEADQLTEGEMMVFLELLSESEEIDAESVQETFDRLHQDYRDDWGHDARSIEQLLSGHPEPELEG